MTPTSKKTAVLIASGVLSMSLAGCASLVGPGSAMEGDPVALQRYNFNYVLKGEPQGTQVFSGEGNTSVLLPKGARLEKAWRGTNEQPVRVWREGPYWKLPGIADQWKLKTSRGVLHVTRKGSGSPKDSGGDGEAKGTEVPSGASRRSSQTDGATGNRVASAGGGVPRGAVPSADSGDGDSPTGGKPIPEQAAGGPNAPELRETDRLKQEITGLQQRIKKLKEDLRTDKDKGMPSHVSQKPWVVPFEFASTELSELGREMASRIAVQASDAQLVEIWGVTTPDGPEAANRRIATRRAQETAKILDRKGVDEEAIKIRGWKQKRKGLWAEVKIHHDNDA